MESPISAVASLIMPVLSISKKFSGSSSLLAENISVISGFTKKSDAKQEFSLSNSNISCSILFSKLISSVICSASSISLRLSSSSRTEM